MSVSLYLYRVAARLRRECDRLFDEAANRLLRRHFEKTYATRVSYRGLGRLAAEADERWGSKTDASGGRLTIVVVTYRQPAALSCLLASLRCQTLRNFDSIVIHDGPDAETRRIVEAHRAAGATPCRYVETETRYNDYGHTLRDLGLKMADGEFVLITNGDNYYAPRFVEFAFDAVDGEHLDLVLWNMVHSHSKAGQTQNPSYTPFQCYPLQNRIDIGSFFVRTTIARAIGFNDRTHDADAVYFNELLHRSERAIRIGKIEKTLMVHN